MLDRLRGDSGRRFRVDAFLTQKLVVGNRQIAEELADRAQLIELQAGSVLIEQGASDNDIYLILAGTLDVVVNGRKVAARGPNDHVGEMAAIEPTQPRAATVVAVEDAIVARVPEDVFSDIASRFPELYRTVAKELSRRLRQRNSLVGAYRDRIKVFIISSSEVLPVARVIQNALSHDFVVKVWSDGVFRATHYTLEVLEDAIDDSDFAVAIAHSDDLTASRGEEWPSPRDNVIFELGLFMGRLGRDRAILMEPRDEKVKLPSDLAGITTVVYHFEKGKDMEALMAPACNKLRDHFKALGPNNG